LIRCIHETILSSALPPAVGFISVAGAKEFTPEMVSKEKAAVSTSAEQGVEFLRETSSGHQRLEAIYGIQLGAGWQRLSEIAAS
jgi:hypothetical protein